MSYRNNIKIGILLTAGLAWTQGAMAETSSSPKTCYLVIDQAVAQTKEGKRLIAFYNREGEEWNKRATKWKTEMEAYKKSEEKQKIDLAVRARLTTEETTLTVDQKAIVERQTAEIGKLNAMVTLTARKEAEKMGCALMLPIPEAAVIDAAAIEPFNVTSATVALIDAGKGVMPSSMETKEKPAKKK